MKNVNQRIRKSNNLRTLVLVALAFTLLLSLFATVLYQSVRDTIARQLGVTAQGVAVAASSAIMEDPQAYKDQMALGDSGSAYYGEMQQYFGELIAGGSVRYLFAETKLDSETVSYVLGSAPAGSADFIAPGATAPNHSTREKAYVTKAPTSSGLLHDLEHGTGVVAYAPIFDTDGSLLGLVGAEVGTQELFRAIFDQYAIVVFVCIIAFSLLTTFFVQLAPHIVSMVIRDELTGAYNRRYLGGFLKGWIRRGKKLEVPVSVLMVDIDHLGEINDRFGREFGDLVLQYFAKRVMNTLRDTDRVIRYSGGSFAVVLPGTPVEMAARVGNRVRRIAENNDIYNFSAQYSTKATVSVGGAGIEAGVSSTEELLAAAQKALAAAKKQGNAVALIQQGEIALVVQEQK